MDIALALGGGGSRGYAHVGVIRRLEDEGFHIRAVAGTSAGGIIAATYAAGYTPDEMEAYFTKMDQSHLFGRSHKEGPGLLGLTGAIKVLEDLLGKRTFDDLRIPCATTAVDIKSAREVVMREGRVVDAVLATVALPGIFPPKEFKNYQLVDGAVLDPVPVSVARMLAPGLPVVAVILDPQTEVSAGFTQIPLPVPIPSPIVERLVHTRVAQAFSIFLHAVDIGSHRLAEMRLREDNPDVIVRPEVGHIGILDTIDVHKVVVAGETAMEAALPELKRATAWPRRWQKRMFPRR